MTDQQALGKRLKRAREDAGLEQADVAAKLGVHYVTVSRWETGNQGIKADRVRALASLYAVPVETLLGEPLSGNVARETSPAYGGGASLSHQLRRMVHDFEGEAYRSGATVEDMDYLRLSLSDENIRRLLGDAAIDRPLSAEEQIDELEIRFQELRAWLKRRIEIRRRGRR